ncbi:hypothetical protein LB559_30745 [Mesorhizobium sp. BR1-1-3]|uniref:hypothetical protein n=1 Tax=Mesorhizobium sp. BR1-1-3 TaxID=2876651 RepID=UPI001CD0A1DF|nr:hypothetical protein [Mesorhizobium sp. BR1-1-3]MBZ9892312.1 hypothetical protein [Mesorhizobium sp. BR1-1-3]
MNLETLIALRAAIQAFNADAVIQSRYASVCAELDLLLSYIDIVERRTHEGSNI